MGNGTSGNRNTQLAFQRLMVEMETLQQPSRASIRLSINGEGHTRCSMRFRHGWTSTKWPPFHTEMSWRTPERKAARRFVMVFAAETHLMAHSDGGCSER